jgi:hypothetical protein
MHPTANSAAFIRKTLMVDAMCAWRVTERYVFM